MNIKSNKANNPKLNEQDNKFFDAYLEGDSPLSEIYKNIDSAEPSNKLNQAILSAARASADQSSDSKSWWTQAGSWAASVAIISLVGILTHNTWQAEQDTVHKEIQGESLDSFSQHFSQQRSAAKPVPDKTQKEPDSQLGTSAPSHAHEKKYILQDNEKDSRKLLYKSAPAPVMQAAPRSFELNKPASLLEESQIQAFEKAQDEIQYLPKIEAKRTKKKQLTEQQIRLNEISQLIEKNKIEQAQELLLQFKTKYPDYPIDPVILKQLSPY